MRSLRLPSASALLKVISHIIAIVGKTGYLDDFFLAYNHADHVRKKNCAKNPWCLFGLGEKEGIWRSSNIAINSLGLDPNVYLRKRDPKQLNDEVLYPPAGLRNLGATCYLNVLIQVRNFSNTPSWIESLILRHFPLSLPFYRACFTTYLCKTLCLTWK